VDCFRRWCSTVRVQVFEAVYGDPTVTYTKGKTLFELFV
jgi:hypothetical protein